MNGMVWLLLGVVQLTMDQAVERALEAHQLLRSAREQVVAARYDTRSARAAFFPQLTLNAQYSHSTYTQSFTQLVPVAVDPQTYRLIYRSVDVQFSYPNTYRAQLTATQLLFGFGKTLYAYWAQRKGETLAQLDLEQARRQVALQTRQLYLSALLAERSLRVLKSLEANLRAHYRAMEERYRSGLVSELDLLRSEVAWRNVVPQVRAAETGSAQALDLLRSFLNLGDEDLVLTDSLTLPDSALLRQVRQGPVQLDDRLDLRKLDVQRAQLQDLARLQRSMYFPTLVAFASYNLSRPLGFEDRWGDFAVYGLQLQWSLFDGGRALSRSRAAAARARALEAVRQFQRHMARTEVRSALRRLDQVLSQLRSNRRAMEVAQQTLKLAQTQMKAGLISELDFQDIQMAAAQARLNWYRAVYDLRRALLDLEAARWGVKLEGSTPALSPSTGTVPQSEGVTSQQTTMGAPAGGPAREGGRP